MQSAVSQIAVPLTQCSSQESASWTQSCGCFASKSEEMSEAFLHVAWFACNNSCQIATLLSKDMHRKLKAESRTLLVQQHGVLNTELHLPVLLLQIAKLLQTGDYWRIKSCLVHLLQPRPARLLSAMFWPVWVCVERMQQAEVWTKPAGSALQGVAGYAQIPIVRLPLELTLRLWHVIGWTKQDMRMYQSCAYTRACR